MPHSSAPAKRTLATRTIGAWFRRRLALRAAGIARGQPIVAFRSAKEHHVSPFAPRKNVHSVAFRSAKERPNVAFPGAKEPPQCRFSLRERASPLSTFAPRKQNPFAERKATMKRWAGLQTPPSARRPPDRSLRPHRKLGHPRSAQCRLSLRERFSFASHEAKGTLFRGAKGDTEVRLRTGLQTPPSAVCPDRSLRPHRKLGHPRSAHCRLSLRERASRSIFRSAKEPPHCRLLAPRKATMT